MVFGVVTKKFGLNPLVMGILDQADLSPASIEPQPELFLAL